MATADLLIDHLPRVSRAIAATCRRHGCSGPDRDEFNSWVRCKLLEDDCAILRKFAGRGSIESFLSSVVSRLYLDFRDQQWGRWRPSSEAVRQGPLALRLERLLRRDGLSFEEACGIMGAGGPGSPRWTELRTIAARLPANQPRRYERSDQLVAMASPEAQPEEALLRREEAETARQAFATLSALMRELSAEERLILHLRFQKGLRVSEVAATLRVPQRSLYRRFEGLFSGFRVGLERAGLGAEALSAYLEASRTTVSVSAGLPR